MQKMPAANVLWERCLSKAKVEIVLELKYVAFLSPGNICENLNFSREIQFFVNVFG